MGEEHYAQWTQITVDELKAFLGFSILMGIDQLPSVDDYWSKAPFLHYSQLQTESHGGASVSSPGAYTLSITTLLHEGIPHMISLVRYVP